MGHEGEINSLFNITGKKFLKELNRGIENMPITLK